MLASSINRAGCLWIQCDYSNGGDSLKRYHMRKLKIVCPIAGVGLRLRPFTYAKPKAFLKIAGKTIIDHAMEMLKDVFPEKTEILFVVGYMKEQIIKHLSSTYSNYFQMQFEEQEARDIVDDIPVYPGLGHAIYLARKSGFIQKGDNHGMFIFLSDRLPIDGFKEIYQQFQETTFDGVINTTTSDHPEHYGVIKTDPQSRIVGIHEKPKEFISNTVVSGIYIFNDVATNVILETLEKHVKQPLTGNKEYQFTPAIQESIEHGCNLTIHVMQNEVLDIGRPGSFLAGNKFFLEKMKSKVMSTTTGHHAQVIEPSYIGRNVRLVNSIIGPFVSIGDDVEITNCIIENSVIADGSSLNRVITAESIIGEGCHLEDIIKNRVTVGDRSVISSRKNSVF
nr:sugar phosphate nucleotidyltransferase [Candidatus Sigynarchaeota archaeon]